MAFKRRMAYFLLFITGITLVFSSKNITHLSACRKSCDDENTSCLKKTEHLLAKFQCNDDFTKCKVSCKQEEKNRQNVKNLKSSLRQQLHKKMTSIWS